MCRTCARATSPPAGCWRRPRRVRRNRPSPCLSPSEEAFSPSYQRPRHERWPEKPPELATDGGCLRGAARVALDQPGLHAALWCSVHRSPRPDAVAAQLPRVGVVDEGSIQGVRELVAVRRVLDRSDQLDPVVEVARHQVGGTDEDPQVVGTLEGVDPGVLEEAADDRDAADVPRHALDAWPQRADATDVEIDLDARLRGSIERPDARRVEK